MLADRSFSPSNLQMPEMVSPGISSAFQSEFHGLPLAEEEQLWGLSPISRTTSWDVKADHQQPFAHSSFERDTKNTHIRNGQPTPPPFNGPQSSHDMHTPLAQYKLGATSPPAFPNRGRYHRSLSEHSAFVENQPYSPGVSNSSNNNNGHMRRCRYRDSAISKSTCCSGSGRPERAKREVYLECNRLAASKCRQKKKEHTQQLASQFKEQSEKKNLLVNEIARLRSEILGLKNEVLRHALCGDEPIKLHLAQMVKKITYNDTGSRAPTTTDAANALSTSEDPSSPAVGQPQSISLQHCQQQGQQQGMISFGFNDALQMRRESETSQATLSTHGFSSTDDSFDDLINM